MVYSLQAISCLLYTSQARRLIAIAQLAAFDFIQPFWVAYRSQDRVCLHGIGPVSYTHLDVYKRQALYIAALAPGYYTMTDLLRGKLLCE